MIGFVPVCTLTGVVPAADAGLNVASKPAPTTVHWVADGHATADHDVFPTEVRVGAAFVPGSNTITLPCVSTATQDEVVGQASPSVVGGSSFGDVEVGSSTNGDDAFGADGSNVYAWFSVVIVVHWVADGQASAIGTSPAAIWAGGLAFPVVGSNSVDRPLSSIATHSAVDGHWTCSSDWPREVSTARGADHEIVPAAALDAVSASAPSAARSTATRASRGVMTDRTPVIVRRLIARLSCCFVGHVSYQNAPAARKYRRTPEFMAPRAPAAVPWGRPDTARQAVQASFRGCSPLPRAPRPRATARRCRCR